MKIAISGKRGKMGQAMAQLIEDTPVENADVIIDFSNQERLEKTLAAAIQHRIPLVSGTTGIDTAIFTEASRSIPILHATNFSLGIALIRNILPLFSGRGTTTITETHHTEKKDLPSGTSLDLQTDIGDAKIISKRVPGAQAEQSISFVFDEEEITITHKAHARTLYVKGAIMAAQFLIGKPPGLYNFDARLYNQAHASC